MIAYDEVYLSERVSYEAKNQRILGPNSKMMVVGLRGLLSNWKIPIYFRFDGVLEKNILFNLIRTARDYGLRVRGMYSYFLFILLIYY